MGVEEALPRTAASLRRVERIADAAAALAAGSTLDEERLDRRAASVDAIAEALRIALAIGADRQAIRASHAVTESLAIAVDAADFSADLSTAFSSEVAVKRTARLVDRAMFTAESPRGA